MSRAGRETQDQELGPALVFRRIAVSLLALASAAVLAASLVAPAADPVTVPADGPLRLPTVLDRVGGENVAANALRQDCSDVSVVGQFGPLIPPAASFFVYGRHGPTGHHYTLTPNTAVESPFSIAVPGGFDYYRLRVFLGSETIQDVPIRHDGAAVADAGTVRPAERASVTIWPPKSSGSSSSFSCFAIRGRRLDKVPLGLNKDGSLGLVGVPTGNYWLRHPSLGAWHLTVKLGDHTLSFPPIEPRATKFLNEDERGSRVFFFGSGRSQSTLRFCRSPGRTTGDSVTALAPERFDGVVSIRSTARARIVISCVPRDAEPRDRRVSKHVLDVRISGQTAARLQPRAHVTLFLTRVSDSRPLWYAGYPRLFTIHLFESTRCEAVLAGPLACRWEVNGVMNTYPELTSSESTKLDVEIDG